MSDQHGSIPVAETDALDTARRALCGPPDWQTHRFRPGHGPPDQSPHLDLDRAWARLAAGDPGGASTLEVLATNLLPDRTVRLFLRHPPAGGSLAVEELVTGAQVATYDPAFEADLGVALDSLRRHHASRSGADAPSGTAGAPSTAGNRSTPTPSPTAGSTPDPTESPRRGATGSSRATAPPAPRLVSLEATRTEWAAPAHSIDALALGRQLAATDVPVAVRLRVAATESGTGGGLRATLESALASVGLGTTGGNDPDPRAGSTHDPGAASGRETRPGPAGASHPERGSRSGPRPGSGPAAGHRPGSDGDTTSGADPDARGPVAVGCRASAIAMPGALPETLPALETSIETLLTDPQATRVDPQTTPATHPPHTADRPLPTVAVGRAADWHADALRGTASTRPTDTAVTEALTPPPEAGLPLGAPTDHAGRPGPTTLRAPIHPAPTVARYTVHHRDHADVLADYRALQARSEADPTIVLDGTGTLAADLAATHRALGAAAGELTPLLGAAPAALTPQQCRALCTHMEGTLLVDPTDCPDPQAVGTRLLEALARVTDNLPDHRPNLVVSAPLSATTLPPLERLLDRAATAPVALVCRFLVPHRQSVFGPPAAGRVRRAWYRRASRHADYTLVTRLPETIADSTVAAITPPTGDPDHVRRRATTLGSDHWLVHARPQAADARPATVAVHPPPAPETLADRDPRAARRLTRWLDRHREQAITPDVDSVSRRAAPSQDSSGGATGPSGGSTPQSPAGDNAGIGSFIPEGSAATADPDTGTGADAAGPTASDGPTPTSADPSGDEGPGAPTGSATGDGTVPGTDATGATDTPRDADRDPGGPPGEDTAPPSTDERSVPVTTLPYTERFPDCLEYDAAAHLVACGGCGNRYGAAIEGVERAIECCRGHAAVDRDDVPAVDAQLKLTAAERESLAYSDAQLVFLKLVNDAMLGRYEALEYDIVRDSMVRLREYAGVDRDAVRELVADGLLRDEGTYPHQLYTITHDGRRLINESRRHGVDVGDGLGDLSESSEHVLLVDLLCEYVEQTYVDDPDCAATRARRYHERDGHRFDVVALDPDGEIVIVGEAERPTNDVHEAVPADYDKMAACDPREAIWVVATHEDGHDAVLQPLSDPADDDPRIEDQFSPETRLQHLGLDYPGLTQLHTVATLQSKLGL